MTSSNIMFAVLIPLIVWRLYSRYRKLVGRQHIRPIRLWASVIVFPLFIVLFGFLSVNHSGALFCMFAGCLAGILLSFVGLRLTQFQYTDGVLSYTPNAYIGLILLLILSSRIGYRFLQMTNATDQQAMMQGTIGSPFTSFIIGLLTCYYTLYSAGILHRRHAKQFPE
jgi:hypothetical protein